MWYATWDGLFGNHTITAVDWKQLDAERYKKVDDKMITIRIPMVE